jgi:hypothetical protein
MSIRLRIFDMTPFEHFMIQNAIHPLAMTDVIPRSEIPSLILGQRDKIIAAKLRAGRKTAFVLCDITGLTIQLVRCALRRLADEDGFRQAKIADSMLTEYWIES